MDITSSDAPGALPAALTSSLDPPLHPRDDGWTIDTQRNFIEALANCGSVAGACRAVGMHPSSAYRLRAAPHGLGFRGAWNAALAMAYTRLREVAFDRAINGVEQVVFERGEIIGTRTVYNDRLLMFLLDHVDRNLPRREQLIGATADDRMHDHFATALDALESPPQPPRPLGKARAQRPAGAAGGHPGNTAPPAVAVPRAQPGVTPPARFDPDDWRGYSGVDLVSTSMRQPPGTAP